MTRFYDKITSRIFDAPLEGETAASRVKQLGLMVLLRQMDKRDIETTVTNLMKTSGLSRPALFEIMPLLTRRGLVAEETVLNVQGRGRALRYVIADDLS